MNYSTLFVNSVSFVKRNNLLTEAKHYSVVTEKVKDKRSEN